MNWLLVAEARSDQVDIEYSLAISVRPPQAAVRTRLVVQKLIRCRHHAGYLARMNTQSIRSLLVGGLVSAMLLLVDQGLRDAHRGSRASMALHYTFA